jgi:cyclomaltodextrinase
MHDTSWKHKVIYHILLDRFSGFEKSNTWDSPTFIGGTIQGITASLPYIKSLGVDVVWISPFTTALDYHAYNTLDFFSVDPRFGTEEDLQNLINTIHAEDLEIICDFVPNHVSIQHPFFIDSQTHANSQYRKWFNFKHWPHDYEKFLDASELVKLNLNDSDAMHHVQQAADKWLGLGFDGLRLDHIVGLSNQNVLDLLQPLRQDFPKAIFVGEAWLAGMKFHQVKTIRIPNSYFMWLLWKLGDNANNRLYKNYQGILDGVLDFTLARMLEDYANTSNEKKREKIAKIIRKQSQKFSPSLLQFTFLDNHDMERFLFRSKNETARLKKAAELQLSLKQPAIIYYGTEVGLTQDAFFSSRTSHGDILARRSMEWNESKQDSELLQFYKKIIQNRRAKRG